MKRPIIVGLDFDGVVAYNPARVARHPISLFKQHVLGIHTVKFFVPKNSFERAFWSLAHESSMFPALGVSYLRNVVKERVVEAHLLTSRFGFLEPNLRRFLRRWNLTDTFKTVTLNTHEEQPHMFKERIIRAKKFDYYVEDNWDIVSHLVAKKVPSKSTGFIIYLTVIRSTRISFRIWKSRWNTYLIPVPIQRKNTHREDTLYHNLLSSVRIRSHDRRISICRTTGRFRSYRKRIGHAT